ncbi:MAG: ribonuclease T [Pseudomonadota bacterium]
MHRILSRLFLAMAVGTLTSFLAACEDTSSRAQTADGSPLPVGSGFDFYVLSLSWSPGYCRSEGARANRQQCGTGRSFEWVVHGLWPQFQRGYPEFCEPSTRENVSRSLAEKMFDIMPSTGLVAHQWRKHGSCSGLDQDDYFQTTRRAFAMIVKPDIDAGQSQSFSRSHLDVEEAFLEANDALRPEQIAVTCDRRFLRDVRICLTKDLSSFTSCPEVDRRHCQLRNLAVVPAP